jgi:hypothetical protein
VLLLLACGREPATGPVEVHWSRDSCDRCGMTIGDRRFAAQLRSEPGRAAYGFDDLGCALLWSDEHLGEAAEPAEIWVRDLGGTEWLEARSARYREGERTPMNYGFGASREPAGQGLGFEEVRMRIREIERERRNRRP